MAAPYFLKIERTKKDGSSRSRFLCPSSRNTDREVEKQPSHHFGVQEDLFRMEWMIVIKVAPSALRGTCDHKRPIRVCCSKASFLKNEGLLTYYKIKQLHNDLVSGVLSIFLFSALLLMLFGIWLTSFMNSTHPSDCVTRHIISVWPFIIKAVEIPQHCPMPPGKHASVGKTLPWTT